MKCKKFLILVCSFVTVLLITIGCIGIFYGTSSEELLGPYLYYNIMPKTIYKINGQVYVPLTVDSTSGKMVDDIPYYIGSVSAEVRGFDFHSITGRGNAIGKVDDDFLGTKYYDYNSEVYTVQTDSEIRDDTAILMMAPGTYLARLENLYSDHMKTDWESYARELDILFDTKVRQQFGDTYYLLDTNFKSSRYYYAVGNSESMNWHSFQKHLSFFYSDLKEKL